MKTRILATLALVGFTMASAAFAATTTVGTIKAITPDESVTLEDGTVYTVSSEMAKDMHLDTFKVGDKVSLTWEVDGTAHELVGIEPAN